MRTPSTPTCERMAGLDGNRSAVRRRGFAMLLVIISLAIVTVSTTAFLAGRASRPEISENVARSTSARAAAETGLDFAIKVIKDESIDWRAKLNGNQLLNDYAVAGATVDVYVCDLEGSAPTAETREILVVSQATVSGIHQIAAARATVPTRTPGADIDLSEFAIFAEDSIVMTNAGLIRWEHSPEQEVQRPIKIGVNNAGSGAIRLNLGARITDGQYFVRRQASLLTLTDLSGSLRPPKRMVISEENPMPIAIRCAPNTTGFIVSSPYDRLVTTGTWTIPESKQFGNVTATNDADIHMDVPGVIAYITGDLDLINGGDLYVTANVTLVIEGSLAIGDFSAIDIADDAKLKIFLGGDLLVDGGVIGLPEGLAWDNTRDPRNSLDRYYDPTRCAIQPIPGTPATNWTIRNKGFVCARIGAPDRSVRIEQQSALYGSLAAAAVEVRDSSVIHYDCSLDTGMGYTNPDSLLYMSDGSFDSNLYSVTSGLCLSPGEVSAIIDYINNVASKDDTRTAWNDVEFEYIQLGADGDENATYDEVIKSLTSTTTVSAEGAMMIDN